MQEYLAAAKTGGGIGRTAGLPYHFKFYIRSGGSSAGSAEGSGADDSTESGGTSSEEGAGGAGQEGLSGFRIVALTLPPPVSGRSSSTSARCAPCGCLASWLTCWHCCWH